MEFNFNSFDNSKQAISYCEVDKCKAVINLKQQLDQLKAENEELKKTVNDLLHKPEIQNKILWKIDNEKLLLSKDTYIYKLEKTLQEIKELLLKTPTDSQKHCVNAKSVILQKISEVE